MDTPLPPHAPTVDPAAVAEIKGMKPWLRFFSIFGFMLTAMFIVVAIFGVVILAPTDDAPGLGGIVAIGAFLIYGGMAVFMAFTSLKLFRAADRAGEIQSNPSRDNLVEFLRLNRKFWRAVGIFYVAVIAIYIVMGGIILVLELLKKAR